MLLNEELLSIFQMERIICTQLFTTLWMADSIRQNKRVDMRKEKKNPLNPYSANDKSRSTYKNKNCNFHSLYKPKFIYIVMEQEDHTEHHTVIPCTIDTQYSRKFLQFIFFFLVLALNDERHRKHFHEIL